MTERARWLVLGVGLLAASCGVNNSDSGRDRTTGTTTTRPAGGGQKVTVQVTDAGSGPAKELRLKLHEGSRVKLTVKVTSELTQEADGRRQSTKVPPISEQLDLRITDVDDRGTATYRYTLTDVTVEEGTVSAARTRAVREGMRGVIGLSGSGRVTNRGETRSSTINIPDSTPTEVREVLQQLTDQFGTLTVPLPVEPVAPGATWTARSDVVLSGARVKLQTDYRLVQIDGDRIRLQIDQHQTAAPQTFRLPTLSRGTRSRVVNWDVRSTGVGSLDTSQLLPDTTFDSTGTQTFVITVNKEKPQTLRQDLQATTEVTAKSG